MRDVPVFAVAAGSETPLPDLEVTSLDAPTFGVVNKPTRIPFAINSTLARDANVTLTLESTAGDLLEQTYVIPANGKLQDAFIWRAKTVGDFELTLKVPVEDGEKIEDNNQLTTPIEIRQESLKVLVVESFPRWEYRYLRNALNRDPGVEVSSVLYHPSIKAMGGGKGYLKEFPQTIDELADYDVIFLGDVGVGDNQLTVDDCRRIKGLVENQATGLILMPGLRGRQLTLADTELSPLIPVLFDTQQPKGWGNRIAAEFQLTEAGTQSLLTKLADTPEANETVWRSLPGFQWYAPVLRAKVGSQVLAVHATESNENGRVALLVTKTFGAGKILFMGTDGAWRWRKGRRRSIPLSILGTGRSLDGLPKKHGRQRWHAVVLFPRPTTDWPDPDHERERDDHRGRAFAKRNGHRPDRRALRRYSAGSFDATIGRGSVGIVFGFLCSRGKRTSFGYTKLHRDGHATGDDH